MKSILYLENVLKCVTAKELVIKIEKRKIYLTEKSIYILSIFVALNPVSSTLSKRQNQLMTDATLIER